MTWQVVVCLRGGGWSVDKLYYAIIDAMLYEHRAFSAIEGATRKRVFDGLHVNYRTLHRRLVALEKKGYLARGVQEGLRYTYYVTEKGVKKYEEVIK